MDKELISEKSNTSPHVSLFCYLSAPAVEPHKRRNYLLSFASEISKCLQVIGDKLIILSPYSDERLMPEPNYVQLEFVEKYTLVIPFEFQYFQMQQAYLRINLLQSLIENLCYKQGIDYNFEYHLNIL